MKEQFWFHIDVNSAFLSWEASYRIHILGDPLDLRTIPSVIGGDESLRHGIVLAKSIPAQAYGIKTGEPLISARKKCPGLIVAPPDYSMYVEASKGLVSLLREYASDVQQYSIDECFCEMTGTAHLWGSPVQAAELIRERIRKDLGFTVNIGVSDNKLLAKMASDFKKPDKVHTLFSREIKEKLWPLPITDLFYAGRATEKKLAAYGITTIGGLAKSDPVWVHHLLKAHGDMLWQFANGNAEQMDKLTVHPVNKGYGNSMTVPFDITDTQTARAVLLSLTETVASRIRADHAFISVVAVSITDCNFHHASKQTSLPSATDITGQIYKTACALFDALWNRTPIRQLGVHTGKACSGSMYQYALFESIDTDKLSCLDRAVDTIRTRYGEDAMMRGASAGFHKAGILPHMAGGLDKAKRTGMTKEIK